MSARFLRPRAYGVSGKGFFPARPLALTATVLNWTSRSSPAPDSIISAGFGNNVFLGLINTNPGDIVRSIDNGSTWSLQTGVGPGIVGVLGIDTDGAGIWMFGVGTDGVTNSFPRLSLDDGQTWASTAGSPFGATAGMVGIACNPAGANLWCVFGNTITQGKVCTSANNGTTWTAPVIVNKFFDNGAAFWDGTQFLAVGATLTNLPALYSSPDGLVWGQTLLPATVLRNRPIAAGNGVFLAGDGTSKQVYVASTLAGFPGAVPIPVTFFPATADNSIYSVGYGLFNTVPTFVAIGDLGGSAISTDQGTTWTPTLLNFQPSGSGNSAQVVVFGNNTFVASGDAGDISTLP